ncbi:MAG: hypothetical protein HC795_00445 [Coleofasciculaceae cyanobacterium RL_1_1]|nr:hypothetical protein [Coleofasciculaceae cyanobacterium RL_1_1]
MKKQMIRHDGSQRLAGAIDQLHNGFVAFDADGGDDLPTAVLKHGGEFSETETATQGGE